MLGNFSSPVSGKNSTATDAVSDIPASIKNGMAPLNVALKGKSQFTGVHIMLAWLMGIYRVRYVWGQK